MAVASAGQLVDGVVDLLGAILTSFNQKDFPDLTRERITLLHNFITQNITVLSANSSVEMQLRDSLIDLQEVLQKYKNQLLDPVIPLGRAAKQRDFATGKSLFKPTIYEQFVETLGSQSLGQPAPSTLWPRAYLKLQKMFA